MMRLIIFTVWFTLILGGVANAQGLVATAAKSSPVIVIFSIGVVCGLLGEFLKTLGGRAAMYGKFMEYGGLFSCLYTVIMLAKKVLGAILSV